LRASNRHRRLEHELAGCSHERTSFAAARVLRLRDDHSEKLSTILKRLTAAWRAKRSKMIHRYPREILEEVVRRGGCEKSRLPVLIALADAVFFASLCVEEGESVRVAIVYDEGGADALSQQVDSVDDEEVDPQRTWDVTRLRSQDFTSERLAKFSRGLRYGTQLVVVGGAPGQLRIEGFARRRQNAVGGDALRIAAPHPGTLIFEQDFREVLRMDAGHAGSPCFDVLGDDGPARVAVGKITGDPGHVEGYSFTESALLGLLRGMRATSAGGTVLLFPNAPCDGVLNQIKYRLVDETLLADRVRSDRTDSFRWVLRGIGMLEGQQALSLSDVQARELAHEAATAASESLNSTIQDLASMSAIDGALVMGPGLKVYGAGYMIPVHRETPHVVCALDLLASSTKEHSHMHGARHTAAFSFVSSTPGSVAFVVSEDGPISCATLSDKRVVVWPVRVSET
jgi:hypothetical protein